ncbi:Methyl-branched lipid omega-hydroxylase [Paraburkholderia sediminicola]|uniref:Methyl-branched lipid omega-hydroxylase n=1 Tax=Paraburkholderia sediminicola TaxID=458836 RepID=A0A6J5CPN9_9BURK|nr:cytochrome P450 [Paraburkholderia sediminicola]CAB3741019.1 Methyl-branched lipid omega-hydroxylase [Paraburkholderia sediminicola]
MTDQRVFFATEHPFDTDKDISSDAFWARSFRERDETFAWLRANAAVSWHRPMDGQGFPHNEAGFWAVTKAADIRYVSQNHELFSSAISRTLHARPTPPFDPSMLLSDPPEHERYRQMISAAFTPKAVGRLVEKIEQRAGEIVDRVVGAGNIDFVHEVSSRLPMLTIADLFGIPDHLVESFTQAGDKFATAFDPRVRPDGMGPMEFIGQQIAAINEIGVEVVNYRRKNPAEDLATALGQARHDGRALTDAEIGAVTLLLSTAGNDTTKQTTSWSVHQLWNDPVQKKWLAEDYDNRIGAAIEEFVRHTSPVQTFSRTATGDIELGGKQIAKHDKVVMYYGSGNRDEEVFKDPWKFDLSRTPNPHVGFGGGGIHYCLGNAIAKAQMRALFRQFLEKLSNMEVGEPEFLVSEVFNYTRRLPVHIP